VAGLRYGDPTEEPEVATAEPVDSDPEPVADDGRAPALFDAITSAVGKLVQVVPMAAAAADVLEEIGRALGAQRAYLFQNAKGGGSEWRAVEVAHWCEEGFEPFVSTLQRGHPYRELQRSYGDLVDERGVVAGPVSRVRSPERELLRHLEVQSVIAAPVMAGPRWWGYLGVHDCVRERDWTEAERRSVVAAAAVLGAAAYARPPTQEESALQRLVEHVPAILYIDDLEVRHHSIYVGPQIETILGIPRATWLADDDCWEKNMHPDDWPRVSREHEAYLERGGRFVQVYRMIRPNDGRVVWIHDECTSYPGVGGGPGILQGVMTDITEQKTLEEQLRAAEAKHRALIEQIPAVVYVEPLEGSNEQRFVSAAVERMFGVSRRVWLDSNWWSRHLHPDDRERVLAFRRELPTHEEPVREEYRVVTDAGDVVWIGEIARAVSQDGRPRLLQGLMEDVTKRRDDEQQVKFLAYHDALTGLSNRVMFEEHLELALARARRNSRAVAILYVDLDGLKRVNDTLGHQAGDHLLSAVAGRLRRATRVVDLVARHGGDEFLVLLPDLEKDAAPDAEAIPARVCAAVAEPASILGVDFKISASIGISIFPDDAEDIRTLLKHSDEAMYASKQRAPGGYQIYGRTVDQPA
jgi:diguanylate cyclase (GGDEF)-like protein/PAS domain S-box-containing protein